MGVLITGLVIFIGVHLTRVLGIKALVVKVTGEALFAIFYSVISTIGLTLIIYGQILAHPSVTIWWRIRKVVFSIVFPIFWCFLFGIKFFKYASAGCSTRGVCRVPFAITSVIA